MFKPKDMNNQKCTKELSEMSLEELWQLFPIVLTKPNDRWGNDYAEEKSLLFHLLCNMNLVRISHIGSTSIQAIWAKPIIDILIEMNDNSSFNDIYKILLEHDYFCMIKSERRMDFNKGYTKFGFADKVFHIHVRLSGDNDELYFRDYLNEHPSIAKEYEALKLSLWKPFEHDRDGYTNAKTYFINKYTYLAKQTYAGRYENDYKE